MNHTYRATIDHEPEPGSTVALADADGHHLVRVARRRVGESAELIDPTGRIWPAVIADPGPPVQVRVGDAPRSDPQVLPIDLFVGTLEWGRFDLLVEKCTEIGIASVTMFMSERAGRKVDQEGFDRRRDRLARVATAAAKQSGQGRRLELHGLVPFSTVIAGIEQGTGVMLDRRGEAPLGATLRARRADRVALLVGADAGFSDAEVALAEQAGFAICTAGATTLRAETAGLVGVAIAADALASSRVADG